MKHINITKQRGGVGATSLAMALSSRISEEKPVTLTTDYNDAVCYMGIVIDPSLRNPSGSINILMDRDQTNAGWSSESILVSDNCGMSLDCVEVVCIDNSYASLRSCLGSPPNAIHVCLFDSRRVLGKKDVSACVNNVVFVEYDGQIQRSQDAGLFPKRASAFDEAINTIIQSASN